MEDAKINARIRTIVVIGIVFVCIMVIYYTNRPAETAITCPPCPLCPPCLNTPSTDTTAKNTTPTEAIPSAPVELAPRVITLPPKVEPSLISTVGAKLGEYSTALAGAGKIAEILFIFL